MGRGKPVGEPRVTSDVAIRRSPRLASCAGLASRQENCSAQRSRRDGKHNSEAARFASWNVRSLVENDGDIETARQERSKEVVDDRKIDVVLHEFKRYGIVVGALQETKWFGNAIYVVADGVVLSSGRPIPDTSPKICREGVALVLRGRALEAWRDGGKQWCAHSSRLVSAKLKFGNVWLHVSSCYAPTFAAPRAEKNQFYNELQLYLAAIDEEDQYAVHGDFNARVGSGTSSNSGSVDDWSHVRGPHGLGAMNDAGLELLTFLSLVDATICNTWFEHLNIHKATWRHPRSLKWHCIDYAITRRRDLKLCRDVRVVRGADCGTDHLMLGLSFTLPNQSKRFHRSKIVKRRRFDVSKLPEAVNHHDQSELEPKSSSKQERRADLFNHTVLSQLQSSWSESASLDKKWNVLKSSFNTAAEEVLGFQRRRRPDWFHATFDTLEPLLKARNTFFKMWLNNRTPTNREKYCCARGIARKAVRQAKNSWFLHLAEVAERGRFGEKKVWDSIRSMQISRKGLIARQSSGIKSRSGDLCTSVEEQQRRWREHFDRVLNIPSSFDQAEIDKVRQRDVQEDLDEKPSMKELAGAIHRLSNGKAAGRSGILPELLKASNVDIRGYLLDIIHTAWDEGRVPQDWVDADIVPIPKKGDLSICDNWRGIALLDVVGKLVGKIIQDRLQNFASDILPEEQCGFRKGRSCTDMNFVVRQLSEKCFEHRTKAFFVFVDLRKAYDSVPRDALWVVLGKLGVPQKFVQLVASFHQSMAARVIVDGVALEEISVCNGLRQGCTMAPVLFNLYSCAVMERWEDCVRSVDDAGVHLKFSIDQRLFRRSTASGADLVVSNGQFADDAILIGSSHAGAEGVTQEFSAVATSFGLTLSFPKTKFQAAGYGTTAEDRQPLSVGGESIAHTEVFKYLGSSVSSDGRCTVDIEHRIAAASRAFNGLLKSVFHNNALSIRTKRGIFNCCVLNVLLYGAETWCLLQKDLSKLEIFYHKCIRAVLGIARSKQWEEFLSNAELRRRWGHLPTIRQMITCRRLQWLGHVARMDSCRLPKQLFFSWLPQKRPFCGPRLRWKDMIRKDLKLISVKEKEWFDLANNRHEWYLTYTEPVLQPNESPAQLNACPVCHRSFKSAAGMKRHKCANERLKPIEEQAGAVQCGRCSRWFASAGGMSVHRCTSDQLQEPVTATPPLPSSADRQALTSERCCNYHCSECNRCFKSSPGFKRHNCSRLATRKDSDRTTFKFTCSCGRRFRRKQDLARHKCSPPLPEAP